MAQTPSMRVGAMRLSFRLRQARSLKDKRRASSRIRERVAARFPVAISEVEGLDDLRRLVIGVAAVSNDSRHLEELFGKIVHFIEQLYVAELVDRQVEISGFDGEPG